MKHVSGDRAYYSLSKDVIVLPEHDHFPTSNGYYQTALQANASFCVWKTCSSSDCRWELRGLDGRWGCSDLGAAVEQAVNHSFKPRQALLQGTDTLV